MILLPAVDYSRLYPCIKDVHATCRCSARDEMLSLSVNVELTNTKETKSLIHDVFKHTIPTYEHKDVKGKYSNPAALVVQHESRPTFYFGVDKDSACNSNVKILESQQEDNEYFLIQVTTRYIRATGKYDISALSEAYNLFGDKFISDILQTTFKEMESNTKFQWMGSGGRKKFKELVYQSLNFFPMKHLQKLCIQVMLANGYDYEKDSHKENPYLPPILRQYAQFEHNLQNTVFEKKAYDFKTIITPWQRGEEDT